MRNPSQTVMPSFKNIAHGIKKASTPDPSYKNKTVIWIVDDLEATGFRLVCGLAFGCTLGLIIGMCCGLSDYCNAFFGPYLSTFSLIPPTAMLAVYFTFCGSDSIMIYMTMVGFGVLPTISSAVIQSIKRDVSKNLIYKSYTLGATNYEVVFNVIFPIILPKYIDSIRKSIGPAMVFLIAAEWLLDDVGFGFRLRIQQRLLNMEVVYYYLFVLGLFGFISDKILLYTRKFICPWYSA